MMVDTGQFIGEAKPANARTGTLLFYATIALVALAPLPLASNRPLPAALLALSAGLLLAAWGLAVAARALPVAVPPERLKWPLILFGAACLWIVVQWLPVMPDSLSDPIWSIASETLGAHLRGRISVNPNETLNGLMRLLAYAGIFWLSLQMTREPRNARTAVGAVAVMGAAYAIYGIVVYLSGNGMLLVYKKWAYTESLTSTFVNRNSFATFAGLCLLCAFSVFFSRVGPALAVRRPWRQKTVLVIETIASRAAIPLGLVIALTLALVLTASRGGVLSTCAALLVMQATFLKVRSLSWRPALFVAALTLVIAGIAMATSGAHLWQRYSDATIENSRGRTFMATLDAIASAPWTGTGLGTFPDVFPTYRDPDDPTAAEWDKAHDTYIENIAELGIPAALSLDLAILLLVFRTVKGLRNRRRDWDIPALGFAASILVGLHATVDFSLQMPAVTTLYAFILGAAVSQSWSTEK